MAMDRDDSADRLQPLFTQRCPFERDRMAVCPRFEPTPRAQWNRTAIHCRYFVVEMTGAGPVPGCTLPVAPD